MKWAQTVPSTRCCHYRQLGHLPPKFDAPKFGPPKFDAYMCIKTFSLYYIPVLHVARFRGLRRAQPGRAGHGGRSRHRSALLLHGKSSCKPTPHTQLCSSRFVACAGSILLTQAVVQRQPLLVEHHSAETRPLTHAEHPSHSTTTHRARAARASTQTPTSVDGP